jgi:hypothetical protein
LGYIFPKKELEWQRKKERGKKKGKNKDNKKRGVQNRGSDDRGIQLSGVLVACEKWEFFFYAR